MLLKYYLSVVPVLSSTCTIKSFKIERYKWWIWLGGRGLDHHENLLYKASFFSSWNILWMKFRSAANNFWYNAWCLSLSWSCYLDLRQGLAWLKQHGLVLAFCVVHPKLLCFLLLIFFTILCCAFTECFSSGRNFPSIFSADKVLLLK